MSDPLAPIGLPLPSMAPPAMASASRAAAAGSDAAEAARALEGAFAQLLIRAMRQTALDPDSSFPGQSGHFRELHDQHLAELIGRGRGLGLRSLIQSQLEARRATGDPVAPIGGSFALDSYRRNLLALDAGSRSDRVAGADVGSDRSSGRSPVATDPGVDDWFATADPSRRPTRVLGGSPLPASAATPATRPITTHATVTEPATRPDSPEDFVARIWPEAERAARELGVPARSLVAQAALETGWGRHLPRASDGRTSYNLFGIKTGGGWHGRSGTHATQEFVNGAFTATRADFRAYDSPADSFRDYVNLLKTSPRYADALASGSDGARFAHALQKAGYATDPRYAEKLEAIANGPTLTRALARIGQSPSTARA